MNRKSAFPVFTCLTAVIAGCGDPPRATVDHLNQADQAYRAERFEECDAAASAIIDSDHNRPEAAEAHYLRGLARMKRNQRDLAERDFESALRLCNRRDLEVVVAVQLGHIAFEDGIYDRARRMYARAIDDLPATLPKDEVFYYYGLSLQRSGDFAGAARILHKVTAAYPTSRYAAMASQNAAWRFTYFTVQCGAFADREKAQAAADALRRRGIDAAVIQGSDDRALPYVLHAGRFADYDAARAALPPVRKFQSDAFVVP